MKRPRVDAKTLRENLAKGAGAAITLDGAGVIAALGSVDISLLIRYFSRFLEVGNASHGLDG